MSRKCGCSGQCEPQTGEVSRREFIELAGIGAVGAVLGGSSGALGEGQSPKPEDLEEWKKSLLGPAPAHVYDSGTHTDARMHLGGIGTGNFEIGADGQFTTWQLFNTLRDGEVPFYFLARAGKATRLLQTRGGPDWPRIKQIAMTGEYPLATLRFSDPDLPVQVELEAFSPFAPLDTKLSSIPTAVFVFRIHNPTAKAEEISLAALLMNPVGYDAAVPIEGQEHPNFGGNVNEVFHDAGATGLVLKAQTPDEPTIDGKVSITTLSNLKGVVAPPHDWPRGLRVEVLDQVPKSEFKLDDPAHTVIWMEEAPAELSSAWLKQARHRGHGRRDACVLGPKHAPSEELCRGERRQAAGVRGRSSGHRVRRFREGLRELASGGEGLRTRSRRGHVFGPAARERLRGQGPGELVLRWRRHHRPPHQQDIHDRAELHPVPGWWRGPLHDAASPADRREDRPGDIGPRQRAAPAGLLGCQRVSRQAGAAHLEIVDEQKGPWGHINVDQIAFSDRIGDHATLELLEELLPVRFRDILARRSPGAGSGASSSWSAGKTARGPRQPTSDRCASSVAVWTRGRSWWRSGRSSSRITRG